MSGNILTSFETQLTDKAACMAASGLLLLNSRMKNTRGMWQTTGKVAAGAMLALLLVFLPTSSVFAAGNGLRVSPVRTDLVLNPGQNHTVNINVTNVTSQPATLQAVINDFVGNPDESGNPALLLNPDQYASNRSLKRLIAPVKDFSMKPGESKTVPVVISIPKNAAGGGYFGAVRFGPAGSNAAQDQTVSLAGSVGSLILVKVPGDIREQLSIASFDVRRKDSPSSLYMDTKDLSATVRFKNDGNVQEAPFGKILLKNRSGKVLSTYEINNTNPPGNVLPDSIRKFTVPIKGVGSFGQYKLEGNFGYGSGGQLLSASTTFYVVPKSLILIFILIVALLAFLVFGMPRLVRSYNRRVIRKATRR
jgi:hypothetical protein